MTTTETAARPSCVNDPATRGFREGSTWEPDEGQPHTAVHSDAAADSAHDGLDHYPPPVPPCHVDHDQLQPRVATVGEAHLSDWACPACTYTFTAITAAPRKADMSTPTSLEELTVLRMLAACKTVSQVQRAHPHLTGYQIGQIRDANGGNRIQELRYAVTRLEKQLAHDQAAGDATTMANHAAAISPDPTQALVELPIGHVHPSPNNPREHLREIADLAQSLAELGLIQPIVVQPRDAGGFQVIAGHRRLAAAKHLGWSTLFCLVRKPLRPDDELLTMLVENGQRSGLDPIEEARALKHLKVTAQLSDQQIAAKVGRTQVFVSARIALLSLPIEEQERIRAGDMTIGEGVDRGRLASGKVRMKGKASAARLSHTHALAGHARARCARLAHKRGGGASVGGTACGECWESVIRADERDHLHEISAKTGRCGLCNEPHARAAS